MNKVWEDGEKLFIKNSANTMKDKELAARLTKITGRKVSIQAVRKQRQKMGIKKERGRGRCAVVDKSNSADIGRAVNTANTGI